MKKTASCCLLLLAVLAAQVQTNLAKPASDAKDQATDAAALSAFCNDFCNTDLSAYDLARCTAACAFQYAILAVPETSVPAGFSDPSYVAGITPQMLCAPTCDQIGRDQKLDSGSIAKCKESCLSSVTSMAAEEPTVAPAPAPAPASSSSGMTYGVAIVCVIFSMALFI